MRTYIVSELAGPSIRIEATAPDVAARKYARLAFPGINWTVRHDFGGQYIASYHGEYVRILVQKTYAHVGH